MSKRAHMFVSFGQPAIRRCNWCFEIEGQHGESCHTRESLLEDFKTLITENKKLHTVGRFSGICKGCGLHTSQTSSSECTPDALSPLLKSPEVLRLREENKKLNDFSQGLVALNLAANDQVSQLREELNRTKTDLKNAIECRNIAESNVNNLLRTRSVLDGDIARLEHQNKDLRNYFNRVAGKQPEAAAREKEIERLVARNTKLEKQAQGRANHINSLMNEKNELYAQVKILREKTSTTMGVGSGDGKLFVYGDYESIKAAQAIVLENERLVKQKESLLEQNRELIDNQTSTSERQRSNAWGEVFKVLTEIAPNWANGKDSGTNLACETIRSLAEGAKKFRNLQPITNFTEIEGRRYIHMSKAGKYFYQEYKPS